MKAFPLHPTVAGAGATGFTRFCVQSSSYSAATVLVVRERLQSQAVSLSSRFFFADRVDNSHSVCFRYRIGLEKPL